MLGLPKYSKRCGVSPLVKVLLWLVLPVAVCVWAVAHGQGIPYFPATATPASPTRPDVPGTVLTDDLSKICRRGYSASVRPPESVTETERHVIDKLRTGASRFPQGWQLDHLVPICLGGDPKSRNNLWVQPIGEARAKDREEVRICREVCAGQVDIHDAQKYFMSWPDGTLQ